MLNANSGNVSIPDVSLDEETLPMHLDTTVMDTSPVAQNRLNLSQSEAKLGPKTKVAKPEAELVELVIASDCRVSPFFSGFSWLGPDEGLRSTPTMDDLAPAMVVGRGYLHRLDYMRPHSGPG
ncbi:unnamed protein product [Echinostoma caproni]|uniref:Uncharacterized protein n=1 Tax=Echinostoma caproni TaxID=27848 RepID=A0A183B629_9TREM|nr:unnamed protein product [Echinostoma caproni]